MNSAGKPKADTDLFLSLTPADAMALIEKGGQRTTGTCIALNSYENRVFELELKGGERVIAKFYRPGRWTRESIMDEHRFLQELAQEEIPVADPLPLVGGETLFEVSGIFCAAFRKVKGRSPEDFYEDDYAVLGRLIARMHNVGARFVAPHRRTLNARSYGDEALDVLLEGKWIPPKIEQAYVDVCEDILDSLDPMLSLAPMLRIHGDCHRGNVLKNPKGFFLVDFDDMVMGPAVQDLWLITPGRDDESLEDREKLLKGYESIRYFDRKELAMVEALRGLRVMYYSSWIARRYHDPAFIRIFDNFREPRYWEDELNQLRELHARLSWVQ